VSLTMQHIPSASIGLNPCEVVSRNNPAPVLDLGQRFGHWQDQRRARAIVAQVNVKRIDKRIVSLHDRTRVFSDINPLAFEAQVA
jgi:hypothetical protein